MAKIGFKNCKQIGDNIMCSCPFPDHDDSKPSFGINIENWRWQCFGCGRRGISIKSLAAALHKPELLRYFNTTTSSELFNNLKKRMNYTEDIVHFEDSQDYLVDYYKLNLKTDYLKERGISEEVIEMFDIGVDPIQNAIVLPIYTDDKQLQGFTFRFINNTQMRYKHEVEKSKTVYGAQFLKPGRVTIVEGNFDVLRAYSLGLTNVVGIMGTKLSKEQEKIINKYATEVVLALDNDFNKKQNWGRIATEKIGRYLSTKGHKLSVVEYPAGIKDFGDLKTLNIKEKNYMEWRLNCIMQRP